MTHKRNPLSTKLGMPTGGYPRKEVFAWMKMGNDQETRIDWKFTREKARDIYGYSLSTKEE